MKATTAMTRDIICIEAGESLADAYQIMTEWEIRHLPVLSGRRLVGILSDRDVLLHAQRGDDGLIVADLPVEEAMTPDPITCRAGTEIAAVGAAMVESKIDSVPVVDEDGDLIGLVTSTDLINLLIAKELSSAAATTGASRTIPFTYKIHVNGRDARMTPD